MKFSYPEIKFSKINIPIVNVILTWSDNRACYNNNNNNNLIYIVPACRMISEALTDGSSRATPVLNAGINDRRKSRVLSLHLNPPRELQCNVSESNEFQTEGAQHRKVRSAKCVLVVGL